MGVDAVQRLALSEARAQLIVETAPDAFVGIDLDSRIVTWNASAAATFGWAAEEVVGRTIWETIIPHQHYEAYRHVVERLRESGAAPIIRRLELSALHRDCHLIPVEMTISGPICTESGQYFGAFLRDVSQRLEREQELQRAKEAAEAHTRTLELLNGISRELSYLLSTDELLTRIGELLFRVVEYRTFSILLLDSSGKFLKHRFSLSGSTVIEKPAIPIDKGLVGYAARHRQPVVVPNVHEDPRYIKFHDETKSELAVPLITKDKLVGVLDIENTSFDYFRDAHVQAVTILASQVAVALENAILYDRVIRQERQLNQDLKFARELQKRMQPDSMPALKNAAISALSRPARIIAGDMFDFAHYAKRGVNAGILGDVAGKGAPAALYGAMTSGIIRLLVEQELPPALMLRAVNQALMERPLDDRYIALIYLLWDDERLTFQVANSGLPRPVYFRNGKMTVIDAVGMPLGLFPGTEFEEKCVQAEPGDVFLFLTDGILEACNRQDEEFGYARLEEALGDCSKMTVNDISKVLLRELASHCDGVEASDDQTLVVVKVGAQPIPGII